MKLHIRQVFFGVSFVVLVLVLVPFATSHPTTHAIKLSSVGQRERECAQAMEPTKDCSFCATPDIVPGRTDEPVGFPFIDNTSSTCPSAPIRSAEILDYVSAVAVSAVVAGGLYVVSGRLRKESGRGK